MNIFQKISYSPTATKVAYGICAGLIVASIGVLAIGSFGAFSKLSDKTTLESDLSQLKITYDNKQLEYQTGNSGTNIVEADLYYATENGDRVAIYQNALAQGSVVSDAEVISLTEITNGNMFSWFNESGAEYQFITRAGFTDTSYQVVWVASRTDGTIIGYVTATFNATNDTFDDFVVSRVTPSTESNAETVETTPVAPTETSVEETVQSEETQETQETYESAEVTNND